MARHIVFLKALWFQERINQISEEDDGSKTGNDVIHDTMLLKLFAGLHKSPEQKQNQKTDRKIEEINHDRSLRFYRDRILFMLREYLTTKPLKIP